MRVERYRCEHLRALIHQGVQSHQLSYVVSAYAQVSPPPGLSMTAFDGDRILLCGGVTPVAPGAGLLWAALANDAGRHMVALHRAVSRFLTLERLRRIEATVEEGFTPGCRWLELLGFEYEGPMRAFGPEGQTHLRYARVFT